MSGIPMSAPRGLPLAAAAQAYARTARLTEFERPRPASAQRPAEFPMIDVLYAMQHGAAARRVAATVALQEFMRAPARMHRQFRSQLREMVTAGEMPAGATLQAYIDRFLITGGEMDMGYEEIFQVHNVATAEAQLLRDSFKILDVTSGIAFKKRLPGEPVQFYGISGAQVSVSYDMYGGGVSIDRVWWDDQDYLSIGDALQMFRDRAYADRAMSFYGLLTSQGTGINYSTGADLAAKINGACAAILRSAYGKGYEATARDQFVILYAPENSGLVDAALNISSDTATQTAAGKQRVQYRFAKVPSVHVPTADTTTDGVTYRAGVYVILPKRKLKGGIRMELTLFGQFNVASYADDIAGFQRYAGAVGDVNQIKRIP